MNPDDMPRCITGPETFTNGAPMTLCGWRTDWCENPWPSPEDVPENPENTCPCCLKNRSACDPFTLIALIAAHAVYAKQP